MRQEQRDCGRAPGGHGQPHAERHERQRWNQEARPDIGRIGDSEDQRGHKQMASGGRSQGQQAQWREQKYRPHQAAERLSPHRDLERNVGVILQPAVVPHLLRIFPFK